MSVKISFLLNYFFPNQKFQESFCYFKIWIVWQNGFWSFQMGGTKLERFLPNNQHTKRILLNFENWVNGEMSKIILFVNERKIRTDSDNFWHWKLTLKVKFWSNFGTFCISPLTQFSKFNDFLWVCWFLGKNLSNFIPPVWKLHNPYCHNEHSTMCKSKAVD